MSKKISRPLLKWYDAHARKLPWRVSPEDRKAGLEPDPYRIWLSEVMLQQTTVATVGPRFLKFLDLWPDVFALAKSTQEEVLSEWAGLGYYARARNLHKCAQTLVADYKGEFPRTDEALKKLPGIGDYTSAAIASIAFDYPAPVMDGNIERVFARLYNVMTPLPGAKPELRLLVEDETPKKRAGDHAQALMDLGATICTPKNPLCSLCPLNKKCTAFEENCAEELPRKKPKQKKPTRYGDVFLIKSKTSDAHFLVRRPEKGLLGGMIALPTTDWGEEKNNGSPIFQGKWEKNEASVRHTFTHFHLELTVYTIEVSARKRFDFTGEWVEDWRTAGLPTVFKKAFLTAYG